MQNYLNPRSKRKEKSRAKRELAEAKQGAKLSVIEAYTHAGELTPDEFIQAELKDRPMRSEPSHLAKEKPLKENTMGANGKGTLSKSGNAPCSRHISSMNETYRY